MTKNFPVITPTMIANAVDNGLDAMYRELQNAIFSAIYPEGGGDGGVAGMHYSSGEGDDLKASLIEFMTRYVELERIYAPDDEDEEDEGHGAS